MLPTVRNLPPSSRCVNGVDDDIITGPLRPKAEANGPSLVMVYPLDLSEIDRNLCSECIFLPTS